MTDGIRVGTLGAIPPALGGGGAEIAVERLSRALRSLGHETVTVEGAPRDASFDVLHAFTAEPHVWHYLRHWTRNRAPLVVTSTLVVSPGPAAWALRLAARLPLPMTGARMRREVLRRADAVVALSRYERRLLIRVLGADPRRVRLIPNGADPPAPAATPAEVPSEPFALLVGGVSRRKRQEEFLRAAGGRLPIVVAGAFLGSEEERRAWDAAVRDSGAVWLGEVDARTVGALQARALAQILLSKAETQSLALLEALAAGTPVVVSDIPSHRELRAAHPGYVHLAGGPEEAADLLAKLSAREEAPSQPPPRIPTWEEVGRAHVELYRNVLEDHRSAGRTARQQ